MVIITDMFVVAIYDYMKLIILAVMACGQKYCKLLGIFFTVRLAIHAVQRIVFYCSDPQTFNFFQQV